MPEEQVAYTVLTPVLISLVVGGVGSILEKLGMELENEKLMAVGKALESIAGDLPKLVTNLFKLFRS